MYKSVDLLPREVSKAHFDKEISAAIVWATKHEIEIVKSKDLELNIILIQPETCLKFYLRGYFDSYRAIPPCWDFVDDTWKINSKCYMPNSVPNGIFHGSGLICAHFSRMAYKSYNSNGPHGDWGDLTLWEKAGKETEIKGLTITDMLQGIRRDFLKSRGHMK